MLVAYLKSSEAQAAQRALADEYRQAIAHFFGVAYPDPVAIMSVAPARASATLHIMQVENVKLLFGSDTRVQLAMNDGSAFSR